MRSRRLWLGVSAALLVSCGRDAGPENTSTEPTGAASLHAPSALSRLRAIPVLGARVSSATELAATPLGFAQRTKGALELIAPRTARGPLRVGRDAVRYVDVTAEHERDPRGALEANTLVYADASRDTDAFVFAEAERVEELRVLRSAAAPTTARWRLRLGEGLSSLRLREGIVEALDGKGRAWLRTEPMFAVDAAGHRVAPTVTLREAGAEYVLEARLDVAGLVYPIALDPGWGATAAMSVPRQEHAGVKLGDGRILVFGGNTGATTTAHSTAEIWDPATGTWTTTGSMSAARSFHGAALLADGKVMAFGGKNSAATCAVLSSTEVWDPATGLWTAGPAIPKAWADGPVQVVGNKVVLFAGIGACSTSTTPYNNAAVLDVGAGTWAPSTNTTTLYGDIGIHAAKLPSGKILLTGSTGAGALVANTFDATTLAYAPAPVTLLAHSAAVILALPSGKVLLAGHGGPGTTPTGNVELFDPLTSAWTKVASMAAARSYAQGVVLTTGKALLGTGVGTVADAYLYDPSLDTWSIAGQFTSPRTGYLFFPLASGGAIAIGGTLNTGSTATATVELMADGVVSGGACSAPGQCASGYCVGGVCCGEPCTGVCETCSATGSKGLCTGLTAPRTGTCDPYVCGVSTCKTACSVDADCNAASYCDKPTSTCKPRLDNGAACTTASACKTGICADGVCCQSVCDGACVSCNESGSKGTCVKLDGVADKHGKCPTGECTSTCAGGACGFKAAAAPCGGASTCAGSTLTAAGKCSGTDERCLPGGTDPCPGSLVCADATTCKTKCSRDEDCTSGKCELATGVCGGGADAGTDAATDTGGAADVGVADGSTRLPAIPSIASEFTRCSSRADCPSGHCVDGVCCDTACDDKCHSCALLTAPGKCTVEPVGVDLRNECGPAKQCLGTCDGAGQCIGAGTGTMCARNRCTRQGGGVGAAYCQSPGGKCDEDASAPFDCGPFVCEPAFGACRTTCATSLDCVNGFVCDVPSRTCVTAAPAPSDDGGCAMGRRSAGSSTALLLALATALGRARTRRSSLPRLRKDAAR